MNSQELFKEEKSMRKNMRIALTAGICLSVCLSSCGIPNRQDKAEPTAVVEASKKNKKHKAHRSQEEEILEESIPGDAVEVDATEQPVLAQNTVTEVPVAATVAPTVAPTAKITTQSPVVTEQPAAENKVQQEFDEMMESVYGAAPGAAGSSERMVVAARQLKDFAFHYAENSSVGAFEDMAAEWFRNKSQEIADIKMVFPECLNAVTQYAFSQEEALEYDVSYLKVVNGITAAAD